LKAAQGVAGKLGVIFEPEENALRIQNRCAYFHKKDEGMEGEFRGKRSKKTIAQG